jgi:hypothetical protein
MSMLPVEVQNKIHEFLLHILRLENDICKKEYVTSHHERELNYYYSDNYLYILLESHDIQVYGFTAANVSSFGVAGTLEIVFSKLHAQMQHADKMQNRHIIEDNIMKTLMKRIAKVHEYITLYNDKIEKLNMCILSLQRKSIAHGRLIYGLAKIMKEISNFGV